MITSPDSAAALFRQISDYVLETRELLKQGAILDIAGLDGRIAGLCEQVLALSGEDRAQYAKKLESLFADLSELNDMLASQRDQVAAEIKASSTHRKAAHAYRTAEHGGNKKDDPHG